MCSDINNGDEINRNIRNAGNARDKEPVRQVPARDEREENVVNQHN